MNMLQPIPLAPMPLHYRGITYRSSLTVGGGGNAFIGINPSLLVQGLNNSTASPFLTVKTNTLIYDPSISTNSFGSTDLASMRDIGILGSAGFNLSTDFERSKLVAFSIEFSITGVSNLNRKGNLYLVDEWTGDAAILNHYNNGVNTVAGDYQALTAVVNSYPISTIIKLPHICKQLTTDDNLQMTWKWTPSVDHSFSNFSLPFQFTTTQNRGPVDGTDNACVFIAHGCDTATVINYEVHAIFAADVDASLTNTYPRSISNDYSYTFPSIVKKFNKSDAKFSSNHSMELMGSTPSGNYLNSYKSGRDKVFLGSGTRMIQY
jgi:hypothetical protein